MAITIDASTRYQVIDAIGAGLAANPAYPDALSKFLFDPVTGLGLSALRLFSWTTGIERIGVTLTDSDAGYPTPITPPVDQVQACLAFQQYASDGGKITAAVWPRAYWDPSLVAAHVTGYLDSCAAQGVSIWGVETFNEPEYGTGFTGSSDANLLTHTQNAAAAARAWATAHSTTIKVLGPSGANGGNTAWSLCGTNEASLLAAVDIIAWHAYGQATTPGGWDGDYGSLPTVFVGKSRPNWMTEASDWGASDVWDATMTNAIPWARAIAHSFTQSGASAWVYCNLSHCFGPNVPNGYVVGDDDNMGLLRRLWASPGDNDISQRVPGGAYPPPKRAFVHGNFAKFVRPGSTRIAATGAPAGVTVAAFERPDGRLVVVAVNENAAGTAATLSGLSAASVAPWVTDATRDLVEQSPVTISGGSASYTLPARSVVSFVEATSSVGADITERATFSASSAGIVADPTSADLAATIVAAQDADYRGAGRLTVGSGPVIDGRVTLSGSRVPGSVVYVST